MEMRKDQHQQMFTPGLQEGFSLRDDDDDEEENRFIICLDDEIKDDLPDELEKFPLEQGENGKNGQVIHDALSLRSHSNASSVKLQDDVTSVICHNDDEGSDCRTRMSESSSQNKAELKNGCDEKHFSGDKRNALHPNKSTNGSLSEILTPEVAFTKDTSKKKDILLKYIPRENCSCIMCYQGRGIMDSNWIPKAAKRKIEEPVNHSPAKAMKLPSPSAQNVSMKNPPFLKGPSSFIQSASNVSTVSKSNFARPFISQSVQQSHPSLVARPQTIPSTNYLLLVPHTTSSNRPQLESSAPLPILIPNPHLSSSICSSSIGPTVSSSPIVSNMSSCVNFTLTTPSTSIASTPKSQMYTSASNKHVLLINQSTVDEQLSDINGVLKSATKVDMSQPGMVLVHFKPPSTQSTVTNDCDKVAISLSQTSPQISQNQYVLSSQSKSVENGIVRLVKSHLISPHIPSVTRRPSMIRSVSSTMSSQKINASQTHHTVQSASRKPSPLSQPQWPYSLVTRSFVPGSLNSLGSPASLPPPPPLVPRPGSSQLTIPRPPKYLNVEVINLEEEQTETIILPLPKKDIEKSSVEDISVDCSKQDEMLLSPSLFTFSSSFELSPKKCAEHRPSLQNQTHPLSPPSSSSSSPASVAIRGTSSATYSPSSPTLQTIVPSVATACQQNSVRFTSASSQWSQAVSETYSTVHSRRNMPIPSTSQHYSSPKVAQAELNPPQSAISIVSDVSGLKMKIRLKENKSEGRHKSLDGGQQSNTQSTPNIEHFDDITKQKNDNDTGSPLDGSSKQGCGTVVSQSSTASMNEKAPARAAVIWANSETAEEMFKRCQDQAMQQVYNAQFGVGNIYRRLRRNRANVVKKDFIHSQKQSSNEPKKKKSVEDKVKSTPCDPIKSDNSNSVRKIVTNNKRKRSLSGENRQKITDTQEKTFKIDINQYPRLMQDNSILNRKTIYTPNILAGHKVFVKFNVYSNYQSGRSFLVPFFNIGGSRTQFDVEDMEYINKSVADFEKEEKSCARHLIYYSREGPKAVFLRKESRLNFNELSAKSYKKQSYILQGNTRARSKLKQTTYQPSEEWKVDDSQIQIEIDHAGQECDVDFTDKRKEEFHENESECKNNVSVSEPCQSIEASSPLLVTSSSSEVSVAQKHSSPASLPADLNSSDVVQPHSQTTSRDIVDHGETFSQGEIVQEENTSHRDRVNILKKRVTKLKKNTVDTTVSYSPSSPEKLLVPDMSYTEQLKELVMSGSLDGNTSLPNFCSSLKPQDTSFDHEREPTIQKSLASPSKGSTDLIIPHIKTEVIDDGYDTALMVRENKKPTTPGEISGITVKSEPVDDFTESLARTIIESMQEDRLTGLKSLPSGQRSNGDDEFLNSPDNTPLDKAQVSTSKEDGATITTESLGIGHDSKAEPTSAENAEVDKYVSYEKVTETCSNNSAQFSGPEGIEASSSETDTASFTDSSSVATSSELESSGDEEEEDEEIEQDAFSSTSTMLFSGPATALAESESASVPTAYTKITSLVESLKQRLVQNNSSLPTPFPDTEERKEKKKKKKEKNRRVSLSQSKPEDDSVPEILDSVLKPGPNIDIDSYPPGNVCKSLSPNPSNVTADTITIAANVDRNGISSTLPALEDKPISTSSSIASESSLLPVSSPSTLTVANTNSVTSSSVTYSKTTPMPTPLVFETGRNQDVVKDSALKYISTSSSPKKDIGENGVREVAKQCESKTNISDIDANRLLESESEDNKAADEEVSKLVGVTEKAAEKPNNEPLVSPSGNDGSSLENETLDMPSKDEPVNLKKLKESEETLHDQGGPDSNRSTPCSEIDVGMEEVSVSSPVKCTPVRFGPLLASPPVPLAGRVYIKDFAKEHDLMPFRTVPESHTSRALTTNAKSIPTSTNSTNSSKRKNGGNGDKTSTSVMEHSKVSEENTSQGDLKPSIASLLCEKLAIEVEPVIPKIKGKIKFVEPTPVTCMAKAVATPEQPTPSPSKNSFYKPTLSAIFGVDNVPAPPTKARDEEEKETDPNSNIVVSQGKPRSRQVAVKRSLSRRSGDGRASKKVTPVKMKAEDSAEQSEQKVEKADSPEQSEQKAEKADSAEQSEQKVEKAEGIPETKQETKAIPQQSEKKAKGILQQNEQKAKDTSQRSKQKKETKTLAPPSKRELPLRGKVAATSPKAKPTQRQKYSLQMQSFFRTWRQLSHEDKSKKQKTEFDTQQICTIPCKVVLTRLEDMHLDSNGQPINIDTEADGSKSVPTQSSENKDQRSANVNLVKKKRKRPPAKVQKRKQPREKKDIVDYYASMLENLRKKAQMLEEESVKKSQEKTQMEELDRVVKIEPIVFDEESNYALSHEEDSKAGCNISDASLIETDPPRSEIVLQDSQESGKQNLVIDNDTKVISLYEDSKAKLNEEAPNFESVSRLNTEELSASTSSQTVSQSPNQSHEPSASFTEDSESRNKENSLQPEKSDTLKAKESNSNNSVLNEKESSSSPLGCENVEPESEINQSSPTVTTISKETTSLDNSHFSDSSEAGDLVIDFGSEQDLKEDATVTSIEDKNKSKDPTDVSRDISDLLSDESFMTKDIVLGFENELGAETVFSTLSQGDEDLFLMEDGEEDASIGMIPEEEVAKLLGLDVAGEGDFQNSCTKQQKIDVSKNPSSTSTSSSSESSENKKLHWIHMTETKPEESKIDGEVKLSKKEPSVNSESDKNATDSEHVRLDSVKSMNDTDDSVSDIPISESHLQAHSKNQRVSPSWNRLLGTEALREMKSTVSVSSQQPSLGHQNKSSVSTGQLRVCAGALSRALKLSAEMKKVFSDGSMQESSMEKSSVIVKKDNLSKLPETQSKEFPKGLTDSATINLCGRPTTVAQSKDHMLDDKGSLFTRTETKKGLSDKRTTKNQGRLQQQISIQAHTSSVSQSKNDKSEPSDPTDIKDKEIDGTGSVKDHRVPACNGVQSQRETRSRARSRHDGCGDDAINQKDLIIEASEPCQSDSGNVSDKTSTSSTSVNGTNTKSIFSSANIFLPPSNTCTSQSSSKVPVPVSTTDIIAKPPATKLALLTSAKGIDLSKLKMKLNPLLTAKMKISSIPPKVPVSNGGDAKDNTAIKKHQEVKTEFDVPGSRSDSDQHVDEINATDSSSNKGKEQFEHIVEKTVTASSSSHPAKRTSDFEPVLNTAKLCNILKNMKKPVSGLKDLKLMPSTAPGQSDSNKTQSQNQNNSSLKSSKSRTLRSSSRLGQHSERNLEKAESSAMPIADLSVVSEKDERNVKKTEEEEKGKRSFFDCLSDVVSVSGAWEES